MQFEVYQPKRFFSVKYTSIVAAQNVVVKLKSAFFPDEDWSPKLAKELSHKLAIFKKIGDLLYAGEDEIVILHNLAAFTPEDVLSTFLDFEPLLKDESCEKNPPELISALLESFTTQNQ